MDSIARRTSNIIQPSAADSFGHTQDTQNQRETLHITIIDLQKVDQLTPESPGMCSDCALQIHLFSTCFPKHRLRFELLQALSDRPEIGEPQLLTTCPSRKIPSWNLPSSNQKRVRSPFKSTGQHQMPGRMMPNALYIFILHAALKIR